jgi:HK97 family phage major capsid protein
VTASGQGKVGTTGQTTSVIYDDLVDVEHSIDIAYRLNAEWQMADSSLKVVRKLKDSAGAPLLVPARDPGGRNMLLGYPVNVNPDVPAMGANAKSILFGDFSQYQVRDVEDLVVVRLVEKYGASGQVGFLAFLRSDGKLLNSSAVKHYANSSS